MTRQQAYQLANPQKYGARAMVGAAIRGGFLKRPSTCQDCGNPCKPQAHHPDYAKPLEVEWLCVTCHGRRHRKPGALPRRGGGRIPRTQPCPTCSTPHKAVAGADLRAAREDAGLSLRQLATLGGMSAHSYLAAIERDESAATPEVVAMYEALPKERRRK